MFENSCGAQRSKHLAGAGKGVQRLVPLPEWMIEIDASLAGDRRFEFAFLPLSVTIVLSFDCNLGKPPRWLIVNWMLIDGLQRSGRVDLAARIRHDSLALVERAGFAEYFNPLTGEPLGGSAFSRTAAMDLHLGAESE